MSDDSKSNPYDYHPDKWVEAIEEKLFAGRVAREAKRLLAEEESPVHAPPPILPMSERIKIQREPTPWRVEGWQLQGTKATLIAQGKSGKTLTSNNLIRALVDGDKFLDNAKVMRIAGSVTVLDFEMPEEMAEDWLKKQGIKNLDRVNLCALRGSAASFNIIDPKVREWWALKLAEFATDYVILDCLRPVLDALNMDEHRDAGKFFGAFDALLKEAGVSEALVIHHMGHGGERSRGDSRIVDWPDVEWRMCREDPNDKRSPRFITAFGRNVEVPECRLELDDETNHLTMVKGGRTDHQALRAVEAVVSVVGSAMEPVSQRGIIVALKDSGEFSRRDILKALEIAVWRGQIDTEKGTHNATLYRMPESWIRSRFAGGEA